MKRLVVQIPLSPNILLCPWAKHLTLNCFQSGEAAATQLVQLFFRRKSCSELRDDFVQMLAGENVADLLSICISLLLQTSY